MVEPWLADPIWKIEGGGIHARSPDSKGCDEKGEDKDTDIHTQEELGGAAAEELEPAALTQRLNPASRDFLAP